MRTRALGVLAIITPLLLAACAAEAPVTAERSDQIVFDAGSVPQPTDPDPNADPDTTDPATDPATTEPATTDPATTEPGSTPPSPSIDPTEVDTNAINFGSNKTPHDYDDFLLAVMTDLDTWWTEQYPALYGSTFESLSGGVYAAYPSRPDDLPGCGEPRTTYDEVQQFVAFYCGEGDFIIYDDGENGMLAQLAAQYGPGTIGIVFAHEFGHAIQTRAGELNQSLPTIYTEQQADCFAGAWAARVSRGESKTLSFSDSDVRSGLIAMTKVSDPVGVDQFVDGGHGSAFDRVGAFQVGFTDGLTRCAELLDSPLPLSLNQFTTSDVNGGNAPSPSTTADSSTSFQPTSTCTGTAKSAARPATSVTSRSSGPVPATRSAATTRPERSNSVRSTPRRIAPCTSTSGRRRRSTTHWATSRSAT